jgi:hypothetical protein
VELAGPETILPAGKAGSISALAKPVLSAPKSVRSINPLPVATTLLYCYSSVTTYPASAGGARKPQLNDIAALSAAAPAIRVTNVMSLPRQNSEDGLRLGV